MAQKQIKWKFNPLGAPHFGGVWERMVRSCKEAMMTIQGNRTLTDDVLSTTMCPVAQILNSRPLTSVSDNPEDGKLKRPVVKLAPMFYESVFWEKNRAGNVGASLQQAMKLDSEHAG